MMRFFRTMRTLDMHRAELQVAFAEHTKTARRVTRVAEDASRENRRAEIVERLLQKRTNGNGHT